MRSTNWTAPKSTGRKHALVFVCSPKGRRHCGNAVALAFFKLARKCRALSNPTVGGGKVLLTVLGATDNPPEWSVHVFATKSAEYEVKVNDYTGKVIAIIVGG